MGKRLTSDPVCSSVLSQRGRTWKLTPCSNRPTQRPRECQVKERHLNMKQVRLKNTTNKFGQKAWQGNIKQFLNFLLLNPALKFSLENVFHHQKIAKVEKAGNLKLNEQNSQYACFLPYFGCCKSCITLQIRVKDKVNRGFFLRAHLHMAKNFSTKCRRSLSEVSTKSQRRIFLRRRRIFI